MLTLMVETTEVKVKAGSEAMMEYEILCSRALHSSNLIVWVVPSLNLKVVTSVSAEVFSSGRRDEGRTREKEDGRWKEGREGQL